MSVLLHALVVFLIVSPPLFLATKLDYQGKQGAGGPGPAGGGGGGSGGSGGRMVRERLRFMQVVAPVAQPVVTPPVVPPPPKPVEPPKVEPVKPPPPPTPAPQATDVAATATESKDASVVNGAGGGSGKDGTAGSGPGSGGGVGSGVGTGRGSGVGPGTGGGDDAIYPPAVVSLPILPLPVPGKVRPYKLVAYFGSRYHGQRAPARLQSLQRRRLQQADSRDAQRDPLSPRHASQRTPGARHRHRDRRGPALVALALDEAAGLPARTRCPPVMPNRRPLPRNSKPRITLWP
ncbi:MAG: hypothetical protein IPJ56_24300 [Gemmatimonadetes bacterium]|nr:hypothetical protein [Gemmatimonadota bacterium]